MTEKLTDEETKVKVENEGTMGTTENDEAVMASTEETIVTLSEKDLQAVEGVKERLRFFFGDSNVRQDVFLRRLLTNEEDGRSVPIDVMLRFNTIKKHTENPAVIVHAAKELDDMLIVDEKKATLSRVVPFTMELMDGNISKSLLMKNLPLKDGTRPAPKGSETPPKEYDVTVDEIRALFEKYGDVAMVKLKFSPVAVDDPAGGGNFKKRKFVKLKPVHPTGSAMIEFHNKEDSDKAALATLTIKGGEKLDPTDKVVLEGKPGTELEVMLLSEYIENQKKERNEQLGRKESNKRSRDDDAPEEPQELPKFLLDWKPGCVIKLRGLPESCTREAIIEMLSLGLDISVEEVKARKIYADYSRGQTEGAIRFPEPNDKIAILAKRLADGDLTIQDVKLEEAVILAGNDEEKYWTEFADFKTKQIQHKAEEKRMKQQSNKKRFYKGGGRSRH